MSGPRGQTEMGQRMREREEGRGRETEGEGSRKREKERVSPGSDYSLPHQLEGEAGNEKRDREN